MCSLWEEPEEIRNAERLRTNLETEYERSQRLIAWSKDLMEKRQKLSRYMKEVRDMRK